MANPIPFFLNSDVGEFGTLMGHFSKATPQVLSLTNSRDCLCVVQGPDAYISPNWYATKNETGEVVPPWNYAMVQAYGAPRIVDDPDWLLANVVSLTNMMEVSQTKPWTVLDAPDDFVQHQLKGIIGIEILMTRLEGKWKVSQNRSEEDRASVCAALETYTADSERMRLLVQNRGPACKRERRNQWRKTTKRYIVILHGT